MIDEKAIDHSMSNICQFARRYTAWGIMSLWTTKTVGRRRRYSLLVGGVGATNPVVVLNLWSCRTR